MDRNRGLGNAVVPQVAERLGRLILASDHRRRPAYGMEGEICAACQDWWPCADAQTAREQVPA